MPVAAWRSALDKADEHDDRVWLGQAVCATLSGDYAAARGSLDRALKREPEDPAAWWASVRTRQGDGRSCRLLTRRRRVPASYVSRAEVLTLRSWLAAESSDRASEIHELSALVAAEPGIQAIERLAALSVESGRSPGPENCMA